MTVTLVTGATGLVGNNVTRQLVADGRRVRVLVRGSASARPLADLADVEIVEGDVRDRPSVARAMRGCREVVHSAAYVRIGWSGWDEARATNVAGTRNVAEAALAEGARMVHVSSIDALGAGARGVPIDEDSPATGGVLCPYVVTKRDAEQVIIDLVGRGLAASIVNPGYMIGPYDWKPSSGRMLLSVARGWCMFFPLGMNSYCDVRDVTGGILAALERGQPGRRYILGGCMLSYFQAWRVFAEVTGGTPPVFPIGPLIRKGAGYVGDISGKLLGREPDVNSAATAIAAQNRLVSSARAEAELGYRNRPFRESARDAWQWFCANGYV